MTRPTDAEVAAWAGEADALRSAATPGPWIMEYAAGATYADRWGEVVSERHPAGGAGIPVPGMRLTWTCMRVGAVGEANAALVAAAPTLATRVSALAVEVQRLRAEAAEHPPPADAALLAQANRTLARECDALRGSVEYLQRVAAEVVDARAEILQLRAELARLRTAR